MGRIIGRVVGILVAGLMISPPLFAQNTASIAGTVRDSSGSVLPGVTITARQTDTSLERTAISDAEGRYTISNLPVGPYRSAKATIRGSGGPRPDSVFSPAC